MLATTIDARRGYVTDLEKDVHWYGDVLGLQVIACPSDLVGDDSPFGKNVKDIFGADFGRGRLVFLDRPRTGGQSLCFPATSAPRRSTPSTSNFLKPSISAE